MAIFELTLKDFTFPVDLPEERSTFRFLVDIRYTDMEGKFATAHAVLPGLDTYWECEKAHKGKPNYVRHATLPKLDMGPNGVDEWDRLIIRLPAKELHAVLVKVFDVEKVGGLLDTIKDTLGSIVQALLGTATTAATGAVPTTAAFAKGAMGDAFQDIESFLLAKLSNVKDETFLLFKRSTKDSLDKTGPISIKGPGLKGDYTVDVTLNVTP